MSDLFREIDSEVRRDQLKAAWDRYGVYILIVAVLIVAMVAGYRLWTYWEHRNASEMGASFTQALSLAEEGKLDEARKAFSEVSDNGNDGYAMLARFQLAAESAKAGDKAKAIETYEALAGSSDVGAILRDYASVQAATLMVDDKPYADLQKRLDPIASGQGPWRFSARELLGLSAYKSGNMTDAEKRFSELLGDAAAPQNMRNRAEIMLSLIVAATASASPGTASAAPPAGAAAPAVPAAATSPASPPPAPAGGTQ